MSTDTLFFRPGSLQKGILVDSVAVLGAASLYSTFLIFFGLPTFMHERKEQGLLNAACVWGLGLLVLVTILVEMIVLWFNVLTPEYLRATVG